MKLLYKDLLKLFAIHIHDKVTFYNFALCNKVCAQISRELKKEKDLEFNPPPYIPYIPLQFWFNKNPSLALPIVKLPYDNLQINVNIDNFKKKL
jgi:Major capsid protein N-terminus